MKTVNVPERLLGEVVNLLTREYEKQIDKTLNIEKKLSDAQFALDNMVRKYEVLQKTEAELRARIKELEKDDF